MKRLSKWMLMGAIAAGCGRSEDLLDQRGAGAARHHSQELTWCPGGERQTGVDVSHWNPPVDWNALHASGQPFGIAAIGDGYYQDPTFDSKYADIQAAGMIRGSYQLFEAHEDPIRQANIAIAHVGRLGPGDMPVELDFEGLGLQGYGPGQIVPAIQQWLAAVEAGTGKRPIIYTNASDWGTYAGNSPDFGSYPLNVASWGGACPSRVAGWDHPTMWQFTDRGQPPGTQAGTDENYFLGSLAELQAFVGGGSTTRPQLVSWLADGQVGVNANGALEVFATGGDGALWHAWQLGSGGWSDWASLGGGLTLRPTVGRNADGRLEAFVRGTDGALWHIFQSPAGGWSDWQYLGGGLAGAPIVTNNASGGLEVFVHGTDGALWHIWQDAGGPGGWSGWASLGGGLSSEPSVARNADGRLEVFVRGGGDAVYRQWQLAGGGWSGWESLGGVLTSDPVVAVNADGRLEVFGTGSDGALWDNWQTTPGGAYSGWSYLGGGVTSDAAIGVNPDGRLEAFVRGTDNGLYHKYQLSSGGWSDWDALGGGLTTGVTVSRNTNGALEVFGIGTDGFMYHRWQIPSSGTWADWTLL